MFNRAVRYLFNSKDLISKYFGFLINIVPKKYILGKEFQSVYEYLHKSQYLDIDAINKNQIAKLKQLLVYSFENVNYYTNLFCKIGFNPYHFSKFSELERIPFLTKEIIRKNINSLLSNNINKEKLVKTYTGGSSGQPLLFYQDLSCKRKEKAFIYNIWERIGYKIGDRIVEIRGRVAKANELFRYDGIENKLIISSFKLNESNIDKIYALIKKFKPKFLHSYPSNCYLLAKLMEKRKYYYNFKGIFCGSEKLYDFQRELIEKFFNCRIISWYGHSEYCILAGECECSNYYHIFPEYGYVEFRKVNKRINNNDIYEIIATGFNNYAMPFIRYRTGDYAILTNKQCNCGRNYRLIKEIIGRDQDYVICKDKTAVSVTALIFGQHFKMFSKVKRFQLLQEEEGILKFVIDPIDKEYCNEIRYELYSKIGEMTRNNLEILIYFNKNFIVTNSGKIPFLIQRLSLENYF